MVRQVSIQWKRLRRYLVADPGRFAGGTAVSGPFGLLAMERERLAEPAAGRQPAGRERHERI